PRRNADLYTPGPRAAPEPVRVEPQITAAARPQPSYAAQPQPAPQQPMTRIVDPAVADEDDEPLFGEPAYEDRRPARGGFLSLFGSRPRYDAPAPAARPAARGGAQPAEAHLEQEQAETQEDLEIPSFLRRLAN
ncbi:cell division protein FtsZ, partial [Phenylobacterium aquaticum]|nr:cell division protein FtsZ [Phenylobacterium aquaticum]